MPDARRKSTEPGPVRERGHGPGAWEYQVMALGSAPERQVRELAEAGAHGWELVTVVVPGPPVGGPPLAYFKRPAAVA
jgi:hypothetical protein